MRRPRDYDSELKALDEKARQLKARKVQQLGELMIATGADTLPLDELAGTLLAAVATRDTQAKEKWRAAGAAFFRTSRRSAARGPHSRARGASPDGGSAQPSAGEASAR